MIREVIHDPFRLAIPSVPADKADAPIGRDLSDTLAANADRCVGMAANMIGITKRIIVVQNGLMREVFFNPVITEKSGAYEAEEGCLSLAGVRKTKRYEKITLSYQDASMRKHSRRFEGWTAQIIQHEIDHCDGILI